MSAKNQLQEFFQKRRLPLPIYNIIRVGGTDHEPLWQATVCYNNGDGDKIIKGEIFPSKAQATMAVAEQVLKSLNTSNSVKIISPPRTVLFVDVENMPNFIDEVQKQIDKITIYAFIGHHHCLATKEWPSSNVINSNVIKILAHSTRPDGTDTAMQVYVGYYLAQNLYDRYYIATRDHYGSTLVEMITTQPGPWEPKNAYMVTQVSHIVDTM